MLGREFVPARSALDIFVKDMGLVREAAGRTTPVSCASSRARTERAEILSHGSHSGLCPGAGDSL